MFVRLTTRRCLKCGYVLVGLSGSKCPECGRAFDPNNSATFATEARSGRSLLLWALLGVTFLGAYALAMFVHDARLVDLREGLVGFSLFGVLIAAAFAGFVIESVVFEVSIRALRDGTRLLEHQGYCVVALIVSGSFVVGMPAALLFWR